MAIFRMKNKYNVIWCGSTNYAQRKKNNYYKEGYALFNHNRSNQIWTTIVDKRNGSNRKHKTLAIDFIYKFHLIKCTTLFCFTHSFFFAISVSLNEFVSVTQKFLDFFFHNGKYQLRKIIVITIEIIIYTLKWIIRAMINELRLRMYRLDIKENVNLK